MTTEKESMEFLRGRKVRYRVRYLTTDRILDQELDENGCPWESGSYSAAKSKAGQILSREMVMEVYIDAEYCVETLKK